MTDGAQDMSPADVREWARESLYYGQYRCECGHTEDFDDEMGVNDVIELHNEHVREEHEEVDDAE